jgi:hypothetical protein
VYEVHEEEEEEEGQGVQSRFIGVTSALRLCFLTLASVVFKVES